MERLPSCQLPANQQPFLANNCSLTTNHALFKKRALVTQAVERQAWAGGLQK